MEPRGWRKELLKHVERRQKVRDKIQKNNENRTEKDRRMDRQVEIERRTRDGSARQQEG